MMKGRERDSISVHKKAAANEKIKLRGTAFFTMHEINYSSDWK
jgi:hypothetical protein